MLSLDVFDTLLTRTVHDPADAFLLLGLDLQHEGLIADPVQFRSDRARAETIARQKSDREDITLEEIYRVLCEGADYRALDPLRLEAMECAVESALVRPVRVMANRFLGYPATPLLISDMYLSPDVIRGLVDRVLMLHGESRDYHLFVSSELGVTKNSGGLYRHVGEAFPGYLRDGLHIGDRAYADVSVPKKLGLKAEHFTASSPNRYEQLIADGQGDEPYLSLLSGCMRATRLANPYQDSRQRAIWDYASSVAAPIVILFVQWVLSQSREDGIRSLAFLARDGQIMHQVACLLAELDGSAPHCEYVYASRQAWNLPSVRNAPDDIEAWAFDDTNHMSVESFAGRVGLAASDFTDWLNDNAVAPEGNLAQHLRLSLFAFLRSQEDLHRKIEHEAAGRRRLVLDYFRRRGVFDQRGWGVVDIGWRGRLQQSLERLLKAGSAGLSVRGGYYFSLSRPVPVASPQRMFFGGRRLNRAWMEHVFAADHGSVCGFERNPQGEVSPVFQRMPEHGPFYWGVEVQHQAILHVARTLTETLARFRVNVPPLEVCESLVGRLMNVAVSRPTDDEARLFSDLQIYEDQLETRGHPFIAHELRLREVLPAALLGRPFRNANEWQEASVTLGPASNRIVFNAARASRRIIGSVFRAAGGRA